MVDQGTRLKLPGLQIRLEILTVYTFSTAFHKLDLTKFMFDVQLLIFIVEPKN